MEKSMKSLTVIGVCAVAAVLLLAGGFLFSDLFFFMAIKKKLAADTGMPELLARGLAAIITCLLMVPVRWLFSFSSGRRRAGLVALFMAVAVYSFALFFYLDGFYYSVSGRALKWYAITPQGEIRFYQREGYDAKFGIKLKPVDPCVIVAYEWAKGHRNNGLTGAPLQFCEEAGGKITVSERPFQVVTGEILCPCTGKQLAAYARQLEQEKVLQQCNDLLTRARQAAREESFNQALELAEQALQLLPKDREAKRVMAQIKEQRHRKLDYWLTAARSNYQAGSYEQSRSLLALLLSTDPGNSAAQALLLEVERAERAAAAPPEEQNN